jgi:hypothetical protein
MRSVIPKPLNRFIGKVAQQGVLTVNPISNRDLMSVQSFRTTTPRHRQKRGPVQRHLRRTCRRPNQREPFWKLLLLLWLANLYIRQTMQV